MDAIRGTAGSMLWSGQGQDQGGRQGQGPRQWQPFGASLAVLRRLAKVTAVLVLTCASAGLATVLAPLPAMAQAVEADLQRLDDLTRIPETFDIMRLEGLAHDQAMAADLFGDAQDPDWMRALDLVYDIPRMNATYRDQMRLALAQDPGLVADAGVFLGSDLGQRIIGLELEARRTALDPMALGAAREVFAEMARVDKERMALIERLVLAGDLIEGNVATALNANVAFSRAMAKGAQFGVPVDEEEILALAWAQEPEIRVAVADFLYPLLALAYAPLTEDELTTYVEFFESAVGQRFNAAVMQAFDPVMIDLSARLGAEAGRLMSGQVL